MNWNASAGASSEQNSKIKRRRHRKPGKDIVYRCLVCEDVALNYNFTVITCESCKAFFRRNVDTPNRFHCPNHYSCKVTKQTRKHCPACRLKKCFDVGMRKEIPNAGGACTSQSLGSGDGEDSHSEQDMKCGVSLPSGIPQQYMEAMNRAAAYACGAPHAHALSGVPAYPQPNGIGMQQLNLLANASSNSPATNAQLLAMMNAASGFSNANNGAVVDWRNSVAQSSCSPATSTMRAQLDSMAVQFGGVALSNGGSSLAAASAMNALRSRSSASSPPFDAGSSSTGPSDTPSACSGSVSVAASNTAGASGDMCRVDVEPISPAALSSPASACTLPLHSPFGAFAEQVGSSSHAVGVNSLPIKHRLKRLRSPPNKTLGVGGLYDSPASNASSASSADGMGTLAYSARAGVSGASSSSLAQPVSSSCASPSQINELANGLLAVMGSTKSASSLPSPSVPDDSPASASIVFDRDGACAVGTALLSADEFKQALETCTRFSTMMQAPFSTAELGALMSNPLPENAFESSVYAEMALRRYVHSLKRLDEFARLDRSWQLFVLRRALIAAHSVNVGFYTDVERRAFLCPREDGSCLYLNEAYFYRTFDKFRSPSLDFGALMKPLMEFHVGLQLQFATQWTIVLAAMSLTVLFSTHYYSPNSSGSATPGSPGSECGTTPKQERLSDRNGAPVATSATTAEAQPSQPPLSAIIQQFAKMAGLKLPPNLDLRNLNLSSLSQQFPGVDLQALLTSFKQLSAPTIASASSSTSDAAPSGASPSGVMSGGALTGLEAFGPSPPPTGLLPTIEPLHRKYLYFLHDYVLLLHANSDRASTAWRFCSEKLEEVRRIADVFAQQAFFFIAQNPQLGGLLVPLLNEIISSTPP